MDEVKDQGLFPMPQSPTIDALLLQDSKGDKDQSCAMYPDGHYDGSGIS
jgi:hypothetical protein